MADKHETIIIEDDRLDLIEKNALMSVFGAEVTKEILEDSEDEELDEELQEIVDNAPALDEI